MTMTRTLAIVFATLIPTLASAQTRPLTTAKWYANKCPSEPEPERPAGSPLVAALAAIVLPKLIDAAVDQAAAAIKAAADTESKASEASPVLARFYTVTSTGDLAVGSSMGCLVVVRATYNTKGGLANDDITAGVEKLVFRVEIKLERLSGLKYFRLTPLYLQTGEFELGSFWNSQRDLSVSVSMKALGASDVFASTTLLWHGLVENSQFAAGDLHLKASQSPPLPYPADTGDANTAKARQAAFAAPHIVAMDVLDPPPTGKPKRPDDLKEKDAATALADYCVKLDVVNKTLPSASRTIDRRCFVELNRSEESLNERLEAAYRSKASVAWAKQICPNYDPNVPASKCAWGWASGIVPIRNLALS